MSRKHHTLQIGTRFARLVIIGGPVWVPSPCTSVPNRTIPMYECRCDCGTEKTVPYNNLKSGATKSCGCYRLEIMAEERKKSHPRHGHTAGGRPTTEYKAWCHLVSRCTNSDDPAWHRYGGRGITVCDRWRGSFEAFLEDMGPKPSPDLTIERVDNDKGYYKENCVWATRRQQADNTRKAVHHELDGETHNQSEWGRVNGIKQCTISLRLKRGWSKEEALTRPAKYERTPLIEFNGESHTLFEWSQISGVDYRALHSRFKRGWDVARMLYTPAQKRQRKT